MAVRKSWAPALVGTLLFARLGGAFLIDVEILTGDPDTPLMRLCRPDASTVPENSRLDVFVINPDEISCEGAGVAIGQGKYVPSWGFDDITKEYYREDDNVRYSIRPRSSLVSLSQPADNPEKMEFAYGDYNLLNGFGAEPRRFYFGNSDLSGDKDYVMPSMFRVLRRGGYQRLWGEDNSLETGDTLIFSGPPDGIPVRLVVNPMTVPTPIGELVIYWLQWLPQSQIDTGKLVPARLTVASLGNRETSIKGARNWERAKYKQLQALPLREDEWGTGKPAPGWDLFPDENDLPEQIARLRTPSPPADFKEKKRNSDTQKYEKYLKDKDERRAKESEKREVVSGLNGLIDSIVEKNYRPRVRNQLAKIEKFEQEMNQKAWEERKKELQEAGELQPSPKIGRFRRATKSVKNKLKNLKEMLDPELFNLEGVPMTQEDLETLSRDKPLLGRVWKEEIAEYFKRKDFDPEDLETHPGTQAMNEALKNLSEDMEMRGKVQRPAEEKLEQTGDWSGRLEDSDGNIYVDIAGWNRDAKNKFIPEKPRRGVQELAYLNQAGIGDYAVDLEEDIDPDDEEEVLGRADIDNVVDELLGIPRRDERGRTSDERKRQGLSNEESKEAEIDIDGDSDDEQAAYRDLQGRIPGQVEAPQLDNQAQNRKSRFPAGRSAINKLQRGTDKLKGTMSTLFGRGGPDKSADMVVAEQIVAPDQKPSRISRLKSMFGSKGKDQKGLKDDENMISAVIDLGGMSDQQLENLDGEGQGIVGLIDERGKPAKKESRLRQFFGRGRPKDDVIREEDPNDDL